MRCAPISAYAAILSATSAGLPAMPPSRRLATSMPIAAARRSSSAADRPQHTTWAAEYVIEAASRPAAEHASLTRANAAAVSCTPSNGTLYSSAYLAASRGVRRGPADEHRGPRPLGRL